MAGRDPNKAAQAVEPRASRDYAPSMQNDAAELTAFYDAPLGQVARRLLQRRLRLLWPDLTGQRLLGYGFAAPYLRPYLEETERVIAANPAAQGVVAWPRTRTLSLLCEEDAFPFPDSMFDRILVIHGLEAADALRPLMRQLWRVLTPEGRLLIVAPNRLSLWAQLERSPFAYGRPFNRAQLDRLLRDAMFVPERWDSALTAPPLLTRRLLRSGMGWERAGRTLWPRLAGVHIVEASKSMYALTPPIPARERAIKLAPAQGLSARNLDGPYAAPR